MGFFPTSSIRTAYFVRCISLNAYRISIFKRRYPLTEFATRVVRVACHMTRFRPIICGGKYTDLGNTWHVTLDMSVTLTNELLWDVVRWRCRFWCFGKFAGDVYTTNCLVGWKSSRKCNCDYKIYNISVTQQNTSKGRHCFWNFFFRGETPKITVHIPRNSCTWKRIK